MIDMGNDLIIRPTHAFVRLRRQCNPEHIQVGCKTTAYHLAFAAP